MRRADSTTVSAQAGAGARTPSVAAEIDGTPGPRMGLRRQPLMLALPLVGRGLGAATGRGPLGRYQGIIAAPGRVEPGSPPAGVEEQLRVVRQLGPAGEVGVGAAVEPLKARPSPALDEEPSVAGPRQDRLVVPRQGRVQLALGGEAAGLIQGQARAGPGPSRRRAGRRDPAAGQERQAAGAGARPADLRQGVRVEVPGGPGHRYPCTGRTGCRKIAAAFGSIVAERTRQSGSFARRTSRRDGVQQDRLAVAARRDNVPAVVGDGEVQIVAPNGFSMRPPRPTEPPVARPFHLTDDDRPVVGPGKTSSRRS